MKFILLVIMTFSFAKKPEDRTPSEQQCVIDAKAKKRIVENSQCKWMVTKQEYPEDHPLSNACSGYEIVVDKNGKKTKVPKKSTYSGSGHSGTLFCGNLENNPINTSYFGDLPNFSFQCSQCSTSSDAVKPDESCIQSMYESEVAACDGNPRMNYKHEMNQSTRIGTDGKEIQGDIIK